MLYSCCDTSVSWLRPSSVLWFEAWVGRGVSHLSPAPSVTATALLSLQIHLIVFQECFSHWRGSISWQTLARQPQVTVLWGCGTVDKRKSQASWPSSTAGRKPASPHWGLAYERRRVQTESLISQGPWLMMLERRWWLELHWAQLTFCLMSQSGLSHTQLLSLPGQELYADSTWLSGHRASGILMPSYSVSPLINLSTIRLSLIPPYVPLYLQVLPTN